MFPSAVCAVSSVVHRASGKGEAERGTERDREAQGGTKALRLAQEEPGRKGKDNRTGNGCEESPRMWSGVEGRVFQVGGDLRLFTPEKTQTGTQVYTGLHTGKQTGFCKVYIKASSLSLCDFLWLGFPFKSILWPYKNVLKIWNLKLYLKKKKFRNLYS